MRVLPVLGLLLTACVHPCQCHEIQDAALALAAQGRDGEAAELLGRGAALATKPDHHDHLLFQQGLILARAGLVDQALAVWDPLYESTDSETIPGRIVYEKGMMYRAQGRLGEAEEQFLMLVRTHPEHGLANTALKRLSKLVRDRAGDEALRTLLESLLEDALQTTFGDDVLWELYAWHHEHDEDDEAETYLLAIRQSYPFPTGGRAYDALLALADLAEEQGRWEDALGYLEEIVGPIGKAPVIGSSGGSGKAKALIRMGHIYEDQLDDPQSAMKMYMEVVRMPELETMNDDGLLEAARLHVELGQIPKACKKLRRILEQFPYSNKHKKARKMMQEAGCETAPSTD